MLSPTTLVEWAWQNGYSGKGEMMIEGKDRVDIRAGPDQREREGVHIRELLVIKAVNHLSHSTFHLGVRVDHLKEALMFERILQGEPTRSFPVANVIADPGKRLGTIPQLVIRSVMGDRLLWNVTAAV